MNHLTSTCVLALVALGCQTTAPVPPASNSSVIVSMQVPNAAGGGIAGKSYIYVVNGSDATIKGVRDFAQARAVGNYKLIIRAADGREIEQKHPFVGSPPPRPADKDYVVLKPRETGQLEFGPGAIVLAYDLMPRTLYFFEVRIRFDGLAEPVTLVAPFGYTEARKD